MENPAGVQFMHRYIGSLILVSVLLMGFLASKESATLEVGRYIRLLFITVCLQVLLGIITLLYSAPITLALLHQAGAVLVLTSAVVLYHEVRYPCLKNSYEA